MFFGDFLLLQYTHIQTHVSTHTHAVSVCFARVAALKDETFNLFTVLTVVLDLVLFVTTGFYQPFEWEFQFSIEKHQVSNKLHKNHRYSSELAGIDR